MTFDDLHQKLSKEFGNAILERTETKPDPCLKIDPARIHDVILYMRDALQFESLSNLSGIDYPQIPALAVIYHLRSYQNRIVAALKVYLPREEAPKVRTVADLYKSANWMEREAYDLFGIHFEGHPDQRRIFMPPDWVGAPLRKDYVTPDYYNGMPVPLFFEDPAEAPSKEGAHS